MLCLHNPPIVWSDLARVGLSSGEFVVNMVTEDLFEAMNISAADFSPDHSELEATRLEIAPSVHIKTPRVAMDLAVTWIFIC